MSLRSRFIAWLAKGDAPEIDPDSLVEVAYVYLHEGPMLVSLLESAGIDASGVEATNYATQATSTNRMRVFVRARDVEQAKPIVEDALRR